MLLKFFGGASRKFRPFFTAFHGFYGLIHKPTHAHIKMLVRFGFFNEIGSAFHLFVFLWVVFPPLRGQLSRPDFIFRPPSFGASLGPCSIVPEIVRPCRRRFFDFVDWPTRVGFSILSTLACLLLYLFRVCHPPRFMEFAAAQFGSLIPTLKICLSFFGEHEIFWLKCVTSASKSE